MFRMNACLRISSMMSIASFPKQLSRQITQHIRAPSTSTSTSTSRRFFASKEERKMTTLELQHFRRENKKISMITAYDYPSARHAEHAKFDMVLVGDSVGMVVLGYSTTQPVTMEDMLHHCRAVRRGAPTRFIVADMPFGSYESNPQEALQNAYRFIKDAGADAIKLEGGSPSRVETVRKLVDSGIAVMGHVGLTPQGVSVLGGFRAQGRTAVKARAIVDEALALEEAGAFSLVVECVPAPVAKALTDAVKIPVIGIGAGAHTSGQVLVYHDLLGILSHPHHEKHVPSFCKRYADLGPQIHDALTSFVSEVKSGIYPTDQYAPYKMSAAEVETFEQLMKRDAEARRVKAAQMETKLKNADEYEAAKLY